MIRSYRPDDADRLMAIWERSNAFAHRFLSTEFVRSLAEEVRNVHLPNAEIYVIEDGGQITGFIALIGAEIGGLFVEPTAIGGGLGRSLVDHAVSLKGALSVEVFEENAVGRSFYERYGFLHRGQYVHQPTGATMCKMAMPRPDRPL